MTVPACHPVDAVPHAGALPEGTASRPVRLGLRANLAQFLLLVTVNALVGGTLAQERTVVPLLATQIFHLAAIGSALTFILAFGAVKAATNFFAGTLSDRLGRKPVLIAGWLAAIPTPALRNAATAQFIGRCLRRAVAIMERVDCSPAAVRSDLAGARSAPRYLFSAAELINHAADLSAASSVLTHEDERRWRIFHQRLDRITSPVPGNEPMTAGQSGQLPSTTVPAGTLCSSWLALTWKCGFSVVPRSLPDGQPRQR